MDMEVALGQGTRVNATFKGFEIKTDQPSADGGDNSAPSPTDLFLVSIGACMGYYVLAFCRERKIDYHEISIGVDFERPGKMIERVKAVIRLPAGFPEKYRRAVVASAESCLVKKHLVQPPQFEIKVEQG